MNSFRERLEFLLCGRKIHPWAASLGVSKGAAENMSKGNIPGPEILNAIMCKENISLSWLIDGKGAPYLIDLCSSETEFAATLKMHFTDFHWDVMLVHDGFRIVVMLSKPAEYDYKGKIINYHLYELITGPFGLQVSEYLKSFHEKQAFARGDLIHGSFNEWGESKIDKESLTKIIKGQLGPNQMYGDNDKLDAAFQWSYINSPEPVIREIELNYQNQASRKATDISKELLRAVISLVEETAQDEQIELDIESKAKVYTSVYRHALRNKLSSKDLSKSNILGILEVLH